jgi:hypothetical protein
MCTSPSPGRTGRTLLRAGLSCEPPRAWVSGVAKCPSSLKIRLWVTCEVLPCHSRHRAPGEYKLTASLEGWVFTEQGETHGDVCTNVRRRRYSRRLVAIRFDGSSLGGESPALSYAGCRAVMDKNEYAVQSPSNQFRR